MSCYLMFVMLCYIILCYVMSCYVILCLLCYVMLSCIVILCLLCYVILCYVMSCYVNKIKTNAYAEKIYTSDPPLICGLSFFLLSFTMKRSISLSVSAENEMIWIGPVGING